MLPACTTVMRTCKSCSFIRRPMRSLNGIAAPHISVDMRSSDNSIIRLWRHHPIVGRSSLAEWAATQGRASQARDQRKEAMKLPRRTFLHLAAGAAVLPAMSRIAMAQNYPARPVRLVVAFAAGGPNDILARLIGQWLSERL